MEIGFHGEYRDFADPGLIVSTEAFEGIPDADSSANLNTLTLDEVAGVTTLTMVCVYPSKEIRDMVIESGMEGGMNVSMDRLEDLVTDGAV